jgi:hypothetical protein
MTATSASGLQRPTRETALETLASSALDNIPGTDFVSITVRPRRKPLRTMAATDPLATQADSLQYKLREGPCYAAVTDQRFVLVNAMAAATEFPRYAPRAVELGIGSQAAIQLRHNGETAGLNLYARKPEAFDGSTVQFAELFATHAGALLGYAEQVEQLSEALHSRSDIGTAVGIVMERYGINRHLAFAFLSRNSQARGLKLRILALRVIDGTFESTSDEDSRAREWPQAPH